MLGRIGGFGAWIGVAAAAALGCVDPAAIMPDAADAPGVPPARLRGVVFLGYEQSGRAVEVRAATADLDSSLGVARLADVVIVFEDERRGPIHVEADHAQLSLRSDDFELIGPVVGTIGDGERFETAHVRFESAGERLWTDEPVKVDRGRLVVEGQGMEIDLATGLLRFTGSVQATSR